MKRKRHIKHKRNRWLLVSPLAVCVAAASTLSGAEAGTTNATPETASAPAPETAAPAEEEAAAPTPLTPEQLFEGGETTYNNWIEFGAGGFLVDGNDAQFQQNRQTDLPAYGGIQDFHYQRDLAKGTTLKADGRALFDQNDYRLSLEVLREKLGFVRFSYDEYRTWYNPHGGYYPPTQDFYQLSNEARGLDRGEISFEAGLRLENIPSITFRYARTFREGGKNSTIWGPTHPGNDVPVRGISASTYDIDEYTDSFALDAAHKIKSTAFGAGLRYETGEIDNALKIRQWPGEIIENKITDRQRTSFDLLNVHAWAETPIRTNLLFSSGFSYSDLDNDFSGSRIYGSDFDVAYGPSALNGTGYYGLGGGARLHEYVLNLNLLATPLNHLSVVPSVRVRREDTDAVARGFQTFGMATPVPFSARSDRGVLDVRERLDINYTGITNWVLHGRAELTQGDGNLQEDGGLVPIGGIGTSPVRRDTDDQRFFQKYSAGARWYPARSVTVDAGGYYKNHQYDYDHDEDNTPNDSANRYPAYITFQEFDTYDASLRLTVRPRRNVTLASRYEYQWSTIQTRPDGVSGLSKVESSDMNTHIFAQDVTWTPWTRLYLQGGVNYVLSETRTPTSDVTEAILNAENNYWSTSLTLGFVLDDKTDLKASYTYYEADNYEDNSPAGLPLASGASEHAVTATFTRRISKNLRWLLRYGYYEYADALYGNNTDYSAHLIYSSLQYRF